MRKEERIPDGLARPRLLSRVVTVNVGLAIFKESLQAQGAEVIHVRWNPPAAGDDEVLRALDDLL